MIQVLVYSILFVILILLILIVFGDRIFANEEKENCFLNHLEEVECYPIQDNRLIQYRKKEITVNLLLSKAEKKLWKIKKLRQEIESIEKELEPIENQLKKLDAIDTYSEVRNQIIRGGNL